MSAQLKDPSDLLKLRGPAEVIALGLNAPAYKPTDIGQSAGEHTDESVVDENATWRNALNGSVVSGSDFRTIDIPVRPKLLGEWFREADLGFIFAPRGVGKTWFAMDMACRLSTGGKMGEWDAPHPVRILYADGEMPLDLLQDRYRGLCDTDGCFHLLSHQDLSDKFGLALNITNPVLQAELTAYCVRESIKVLFLDNLSTLATGMAENDSDDWEKVNPWLLTMRRLGIAVVIVHHAGRNGELRGTSRREDNVFWIISLVDANDSSADPRGARFVSRFTKKRNTQESIPAIQWHYQTDDLTGEVRRSFKVADNLEVLCQMIGDGITGCSELAEEMGISKGQVSKLATRAIKAGRVRKDRKEYALVIGAEGGNEVPPK